MSKWIPVLLIVFCTLKANAQDANALLDRIDKNMSSETRIFESSMTVHSNRKSRTINSRTWSSGDRKAFTEYLSPPREQGTKMLKIGNQLWIYSPQTDRTIQISGHMLRQSVMGSDLSYEDMMETGKLSDQYNASISGKEDLDGRKTILLELKALNDQVTYASRKIWVDEERFVPLKEELFAKSGQLLKRTELSDIRYTNGRWFPYKIIFRDMLKTGLGTEFEILSIEFDVKIPEYLFTKAALK